MVNLETTTHVAGPIVKIGERVVQRCCVCGEKLADNENDEMFVFWCEGEILRAREGDLQPHRIGDFLNLNNEGAGLPDDFCLDLVEV